MSRVREEAMSRRRGGRAGPRRRRAVYGWGAVAVALLACDRPDYSYSPDLPINGTGASPVGVAGSGIVGTGGSFTTGGVPSGGDACTLDRPTTTPAFSKQTISNQLPARRSVYLQMTDEEVEALKATGALLPPPTDPPKTTPLRSLLMQLQATASDARKPLVQELIKRFPVTRPTWPNAWALRLVEHPGSQHMNPVRLTFKPNAWIVRILDGSPAIVDLDNAIVTISSATAEPERLAAIYYVADDRSPGALATCETGKRELALGNPSMVEEFSVGTEEILKQIGADIAALELLFNAARPCSSVDRNGMTFHAFTVCQTWRFFDASTEFLAYQWALVNPVEAYKPTPQNLATLIQALKDDRFEPEPFVGTPVPTLGEAGAAAGGAGGEGGAADAGGEGGVPFGGASP